MSTGTPTGAATAGRGSGIRRHRELPAESSAAPQRAHHAGGGGAEDGTTRHASVSEAAYNVTRHPRLAAL